jgi:hypothetical protein
MSGRLTIAQCGEEDRKRDLTDLLERLMRRDATRVGRRRASCRRSSSASPSGSEIAAPCSPIARTSVEQLSAGAARSRLATAGEARSTASDDTEAEGQLPSATTFCHHLHRDRNRVATIVEGGGYIVKKRYSVAAARGDVRSASRVRLAAITFAGLCLGGLCSAHALTADEIIAQHIAARGGVERLQALKTLKRRAADRSRIQR